MNRVKRLSLLILAAVALACWVAAVAADSVWVSSDGETHEIHESGHVMWFDDGDALDLSELADGETRVIGSGDSAVTVSRSGNLATIARPAVGDREALDVRCDLSRDTCKVKAATDDPERVMIIVQRERECVDGEGDCDEPLEIGDLGGDGHRIMIRKVVDCADEDNCAETEEPAGAPHVLRIEALAGEASEGHVWFMGAGGDVVGSGADGEVIVLPRSDSVVLRCPEGDATLRVTKDEAAQVFLCPKHSTPLAKVEPRVGVRELRLRKRAESH